jgi:phosphatidylethanolamine-binding protein (PEBP) family uncharacterized protein
MGKKSMAGFLAFGALAGMPNIARAAEPFTLTSAAFKDGEVVPAKYAGAHPGRNCGGDNVSPQLSWSNAPEKTKSFAMVMTDPEGGRGLGSVHWVAYGIPAARFAASLYFHGDRDRSGARCAAAGPDARRIVTEVARTRAGAGRDRRQIRPQRVKSQ